MAQLVYIGLILSVCALVHSARILAYFPVPSISHQVAFRPLTQELAKRGHEVVVITPDPVFPPGQAPENLTEIDLHMSYELWREKILVKNFASGKKDDIVKQMTQFLPVIIQIVKEQLQSEAVQNIINNKTQSFDLLLVESCVRPALIMSNIFKGIPVILVSSFGEIGNALDIVGAPSRPVLLYPAPFRQKLFNLTIVEKLVELYNDYQFVKEFEKCELEGDVMFRNLFGPNTPTLKELAKNVGMLFLNVHPMWEFNRPVPPGVVYMGGVHQKPVKELPKELKSYLDSSKHGVIYISFGTNVSPSQLPPEKIQMLVKVFSKLPYDVLWKWDRDVLPGRTANIRISKWLPQSDLLKHPKVKLFITQGGLQSTDEAITAGVPLLGVPMLGDQWFNVEHYDYFKIGLGIDMDTATEEMFTENINTLINDESYRKNMVRLRAVMADQPQSPLERAVWWTEHVLRHGGAAHLRAPAANLSWPEYLDVELLLVLALIAFTCISVLGYAVTLLLRFVKQNVLQSSKLKTN